MMMSRWCIMHNKQKLKTSVIHITGGSEPVMKHQFLICEQLSTHLAASDLGRRNAISPPAQLSSRASGTWRRTTASMPDSSSDMLPEASVEALQAQRGSRVQPTYGAYG